MIMCALSRVTGYYLESSWNQVHSKVFLQKQSIPRSQDNTLWNLLESAKQCVIWHNDIMFQAAQSVAPLDVSEWKSSSGIYITACLILQKIYRLSTDRE